MRLEVERGVRLAFVSKALSNDVIFTGAASSTFPLAKWRLMPRTDTPDEVRFVLLTDDTEAKRTFAMTVFDDTPKVRGHDYSEIPSQLWNVEVEAIRAQEFKYRFTPTTRSGFVLATANLGDIDGSPGPVPSVNVAISLKIEAEPSFWWVFEKQ